MKIFKTLLLFIIVSTLIFSCSRKHTTKTNIPISENTFKQDSLAFELCKMYGFDQGIRDNKLSFNKKELMPKIDSTNFSNMVDFIIKNGYPTEALLGERNMKHECVEAAIAAILLHNPHRLVNEKVYFDLFLKEVNKGNIDNAFFASVLDKYYWLNSTNKKQRRVFYGSQFGKPCIQTKEATNIARIEIGLKPLNDNEFIDCGQEVLNMPKKRY
ncbi:hypothetical protein [Flavobacterium microcysteis]|uniref:Lipoprotein n=1 Tax=Flavobacterium microcysteis TaxID=2596891 RepID=A0A501QAU9_9FLAO|nr:hypothetical protein [Flavobacterium microcysteis]TPD70010.1 hypothetical protein FJA49_08905 [Flavobacterium microcysteis]